ncbi:NmrA family NAD(P)-binding protein [Dyadobacter frigoris]|uniref:NAD-dependent epimerase/dehydratase family protein n=1 Tax=Dyadobacter frigoris TaxID=2576211 RepID=A0A4U6D7G1_9BACT|nr:NmrA family NAD(P)-binding protein [Dyadobacter frigoris]TKT93370.1 NAD-dependent epimerase/dehydratase family protein [Dyadobacter frigoris]GLU54683.1 NAD(P)-dependent oxidoreductase [Dyadobacter frigoris]
MNRKVLITGATGATGSNAINRLLELGVSTRAMVHQIDDRSKDLERRGVEVIKGNITNLEDLSNALKGIDAAYYIYPLGTEGIVESTAFFAQAAIEQQVGHIVNMSQISARRDSKSHTAQRHWVAERIFDRTGIPITHLRPTFFAETTLNYVMEVKKNNRLALPFGDSKYAPIAAEDQGNVIATILSNPERHAGKVYPLYGPEELTQYDTAEILSAVLRRKITYIPMEISEFGEYLKGKRTDLQIQHLEAVAQDCRDGLFAGTNDTVEKITGQKPINMRDFISSHKESFQ